MWRYRRPGFETLLLAELQRQQQCSQLCDTVLRAGGVSVPAHSCVLSTLSPQLSCTLSSSPSPPTGQTQLVEFHTVGAGTLLQLVGLLYSGEMVGEGEKQRQEAISAAAKLGIHGLVEVRKGDGKDGREEGSQQREVGIQTEPLMCEGNGVGKWRREVRDGGTLLWKETPSNGERDTWMEMGEVETSVAHPPLPAISFQTVDMAAIQSSGEPDLHLPPHIPYVPLSLLHPADGSQALAHYPPSAVLMATTEESCAAEHTPIFVLSQSYSSGIPPPLPSSHVSAAVSSQVTQDPPLFATDPQSWWAGPQGAGREVVAAEGEDGEGFEQFMGNIPGFISYFLDPGQEEGYCGRRTGRRRGGRVGGARRAGTGERRGRRPRARTRGRGRGAAQIADVEDVVVSGPQEDWLQRLGVQASRTGEGGGAAGRKLYLKTRELLQPLKICLKRRGRGEVWEISQSGEALLHGERGEGNVQHGRKRSATPQLTQDGVPVSKSQRGSAESVFFSSSPMRLYSIQTPDPSASTEPYVAPAPALPPPPQEDQTEQIERLLEEVMMGLDILPNNSALHPHPPTHPTSGTSCTYPSSGHAVVQQDQLQQCLTAGLQEAASGLRGSTETVAVAAEVVGPSPVKGEVPVLQQPQGEGELSNILDHFLRSFEQLVPNCSAGAEVEMDGQSYTQASLPQPDITLRDYSQTQIHTSSATHCTHTSSTVQETPHLEHTHSPHPPQTITPPAHTPYPAVYTPPPPFLSPLTNTAEPPLALPPVSTVLPHNRDVVIKEREEKEVTRRQRRERTDSQMKASFVRLTALLEGEIVRPETPASHSQPCTDSTPCAVTAVVSSSLPATSNHKQPKAPKKVRGPGRPQGKRKKSQTPKRIRARKPACTSDTKTKSECERGGMVAQQLQQVSVVTLERTDPLPGEETDTTRQGFRCQSLEVKSPTESQAQKAKTNPSLMKGPPDKKHPTEWTRKSYPIRSRFREENIMQSIPLVEPLSGNRQRPAGTQVVKSHLAQPMRMEENDLTGDGRDKLKKRLGPPWNKTLLLCLSKGENSTSPSQPQDVEHCGMDKQLDKNRDRHEEELAEACRPARWGKKRRIMPAEERNDAHVAKRVCLEQVAPSTSEPCTPSSESAPSVSEPQDSTQDVRGEAAEEATVTVDTGEEVDAEIISLPGSENDLQTLVSEGDILQGGAKEEEEETWNKIKLEETDENGERRESLMDEEMERSREKVIVVDDDSDGSIGVVDSDADFREEVKKDQRHQNLPNGERKTAALSHVGRAKPPVSPPSHSAVEVNPGSTGSSEEEVDVIGGSSPLPEPLPISWTEVFKSEEEEEEEEEEIDIIGGEMD